jgi:hypothetical protein
MRTLVSVLVLALPAAAQVGVWSTPTNLAPVNTAQSEFYPQLSYDGLTLRWSCSARADLPGSPGGWDVYQVTRPFLHGGFGPASREPGSINTPSNDLGVHVMPDGLTAYCTTVTGATDIFQYTRALPTDPWGAGILVAPWAGTGTDFEVSVTADGQYAMWSGARTGLGDLYESHFVAGSWTPAVLVAPLSTATADYGPSMAPDGLTAWFAGTIAGGPGAPDLLVTTRKLRTDPWGPPVLVPGVNSTALDRRPGISPDGRELYFTSARPGGLGSNDIWVSTFTGLTHQNLPQPGATVLFHVTVPTQAGALYQVAMAFASAPGIPVPGVGTIPLTIDALFLLSISGVAPTIFTNFTGNLDAFGEATASLNIPALGILAGIDFSVAAVTLSGGSISFITNGEDLKINP